MRRRGPWVLPLAFVLAGAWLVCDEHAAAQVQPSATPTPAQQSAAPAPASPQVLVLVPYGEPDNKDPHATGETQALQADLSAGGITTKTIDPIDHLRAVAGASGICRDNAASGLLVAEGRYEQTEHTTMIPMAPVQMSSFPAHVELRLDEIDCGSNVVWSAHATGDQSTAGANLGFGSTSSNVGSVVDVGFRNATAQVVASLEKAPAIVASAQPQSTTPPPPPTSSTAAVVYLIVPFEQPNLADPRAPDITRSLAGKFQDRHLTAKVGTPIDRLTAVSAATALCSANGATAIVVPSVRLEQARRSHAELRLDLLDCNGHVLSSALSEADIPFGYSGKALIKVAEDAMDPALDQLLAPATK